VEDNILRRLLVPTASPMVLRAGLVALSQLLDARPALRPLFMQLSLDRPGILIRISHLNYFILSYNSYCGVTIWYG
jgi:hypothetical protein